MMIQIKTEQENKERHKRLVAMGIKPIYETLEDKRKAIREANKIARELGFARGIKQFAEEFKE